MSNKNITIDTESPIFIYSVYAITLLVSLAAIGWSVKLFYSSFYSATDKLNKLTEQKSETSFDQINYSKFDAIANLTSKNEPITVNANTPPIIK